MKFDHALLKSLPKVLLHEHLDGVVRPQTAIDLADRTGYTGLPTRDPHALGIVVHVEVIKLNPKVTSAFRKDFTLDYEGDAVNVWAMDVLPDGNFVEADPPVEPITAKFYRTNKEQEAALPALQTP